jgi:outer membrane lipoprotein
MRLVMAIVLSAMVFGCAHAISKETRSAVGEGVEPQALFKDPDAYKGRTVMLGGVIVNSVNAPEGTYMEVVQLPLDYRGRPRPYEDSSGRFLVLHGDYLETAIYSRGRLVTVAGVVRGRSVRPLGETEYAYPLVESREIRLFRSRTWPRLYFGVGVFHGF